jgi:hypothetical protein
VSLSKYIDGKRTADWKNYGFFNIDVYTHNPAAIYQKVQTCLDSHVPTFDHNRPFYVWPGPEYKVALQCPLTFNARIESLYQSGYTWAHISTTPGLPAHLTFLEGG